MGRIKEAALVAVWVSISATSLVLASPLILAAYVRHVAAPRLFRRKGR